MGACNFGSTMTNVNDTYCRRNKSTHGEKRILGKKFQPFTFHILTIFFAFYFSFYSRLVCPLLSLSDKCLSGRSHIFHLFHLITLFHFTKIPNVSFLVVNWFFQWILSFINTKVIVFFQYISIGLFIKIQSNSILAFFIFCFWKSKGSNHCQPWPPYPNCPFEVSVLSPPPTKNKLLDSASP